MERSTDDRQPHGVADVAAFLRDRGWPTATRIKRIAHGEWSRAFSFAAGGDPLPAAGQGPVPTAGQRGPVAYGRAGRHSSALRHGPNEYVVRFSPLEEDFRKDQLAAAFAEPRLPIPRLVDLGDAFDGYYTIAERAWGTYLDSLDTDGMRRALPSLLQAIDAMREADVSGTAGYGVWDATGRAPAASWAEALLLVGEDASGSRLDGWRDALARSPTGLEPFETGVQRLRERVGALPHMRRHLIHADLLNYNVLVQGADVSAVLDWGSAMYGDWVFDIAWFSFWQAWYPAWTGIDFEAEAQRHFGSLGLNVPAFSARMRCCELVIGLGNQAYCAFRGEARWAQLAAVAHRTLTLSQR